jgi:hypothetical protein
MVFGVCFWEDSAWTTHFGLDYRSARRVLTVEEIEDDQNAIEEDLKEEQALGKELDELEEEAKRLEEEHRWRMAALKGEPLPPESND